MESVIEIVAKISGKSCQQIQSDSNLRTLGITSSIEILKIQSALERSFNLKLNLLKDNLTIKQIAACVGESSSDTSLESTPPAPLSDATYRGLPPMAYSGTSPFMIGIDIEEVANLPQTSNYREHEFYCSQFRPEEISYALLKSKPRIHLCGFFCAKEALKKSSPNLIHLSMSEIYISHQQGRPFVSTTHETINSSFDFQVSISHTLNYAVATVLTVQL